MDLNVSAADQALVLFGSPLTTRVTIEKQAQILLETFQVPAIHFSDSGLLGLYATGRTTGVVLDCGHARSCTSATLLGLSVTEPSFSEIAGNSISESLLQLIQQKNKHVHLDEETAGVVKESLCVIPSNFDTELQTSLQNPKPNQTFTLPDGQVIDMNPIDLLQATEAMFSLDNGSSIPSLIASQLRKCPIDSRALLSPHVLLIGGGSSLPGFATRIMNDVQSRYGLSINAEYHADAAWKGGAILANLPSFNRLCITSPEFAEFGPNIVFRNRFK